MGSLLSPLYEIAFLYAIPAWFFSSFCAVTFLSAKAKGEQRENSCLRFLDHLVLQESYCRLLVSFGLAQALFFTLCVDNVN